jgi:hypothetical protein
MLVLTVRPNELVQTADYPEQAAAAAGDGVEATESADLGGFFGKLYETHGPISGPSNEAISAMAQVREEAGRAIQQACLRLAGALNTAAAAYAGIDSICAGTLDEQLRG